MVRERSVLLLRVAPAGVDVKDQVEAVAAARRAAPGLGLSQAVELVREARERASA
ncbi:hypothetical protein AB0H29_19170 [Streptomyces thermolilacinus]